MLQRCHFTSYDEYAILSCVAVVKPTPVPTKAPTPPPPATVPPALDGEDSFNQCIYSLSRRDQPLTLLYLHRSVQRCQGRPGLPDRWFLEYWR